LLTVDEHSTESPGFALPEKKRLIVGSAAEKKAHLYPLQIMDRFWDQLNVEPLEQPNPFADNHAELAYEHMARIWEAVKTHGNEMVIAVPGFFTRNHMGLILGITRELSIPVRGLVAQAVAAASSGPPEGLLLHLDIHLHRAEVTYLKRDNQITQADSFSAEGSGISRLYKEWVKAIAEEFVRSTRFDPLHRAASEQELYERLPGILEQLQQNPTAVIEMKKGARTYHVILTRDLFWEKSESVYREIGRLIDRMREKYEKDLPVVVLQLTHRLTRLPGIKEMLAGQKDRFVIELEPGAAAFGALQFRDQLSYQQAGQRAPYLASRSLPAVSLPQVSPPRFREAVRPTHILYRNLAYPITEQPLIIGRKSGDEGEKIVIGARTDGGFDKHCSIRLQGQDIVLNDFSRDNTFVDEERVTGKIILRPGQVIRLGTPGETLQLITCLDFDEIQESNDI
jgi:hypothetical protein